MHAGPNYRSTEGKEKKAANVIDIIEEKMIAVRDVPRHLPARRNGKRVHVSAVYRWSLRGLRGVVLETIRFGGTLYPSAEALQRFAESLTTARLEAAPPAPVPTRKRQRQVERAEREVAAVLGLPTAAGKSATVKPPAANPSAGPGSPSAHRG